MPRKPLKTACLLSTPIALIILAHAPTPAFADTAPDSSTETVAPDNSYHYNDATGLWENGTYSWNPATGQTAPLTPTNYSYNPSTSMWDTDDYRYDPSTGTYVANTAPNSTNTSTTDGDEQSNSSTGGPTGSTSTNTSNGSGSLGTVNNPGPGSNNHTLSDSEAAQSFSGFYNASISNRFDSNAYTGDAEVSRNTNGGSATSGDAVALANFLNILASTWNLGGGSFASFSTDIHGNVVGDLYIDPANLGRKNNGDPTSSVMVNSQNSGNITNSLNLGAGSGDATVSGNTSAGDATSGNAAAIVNLLNLINSAIGSGQSFMGVINIYGDFNGDILLPPGALDNLLASNSVPTVGDVDLTYQNTDNQAINNNLTSSATSGHASVTGNTIAGSASTGSALTNVTLLNLTGHSVIARDTLLVFVNVLGQWVGLLMNAPLGTTAAAIGGGVSSNRVGPQISDINTSSQNTINNNINLAARTGDATVDRNTTAGNATTGDASTSANIANIINSDFNLSDWFGVLFINVFGNWTGSFGIDTAAGTVPGSGGTSAPAGGQSNPVISPAVFRFVSSSNNGVRYTRVNTSGVQTASATPENGDSQVLGAESDDFAAPTSRIKVTDDNKPRPWILPLFGFAIGTLLLAGDQAYSVVTNRRH